MTGNAARGRSTQLASPQRSHKLNPPFSSKCMPRDMHPSDRGVSCPAPPLLHSPPPARPRQPPHPTPLPKTAQAIAWLGWVGGLLCLTCFYVIQNGASLLLASLYEDKKGRKHGTYQGAVEAYLGERLLFTASAKALSLAQKA